MNESAGKPTILIVDDDPSNLSALSALLAPHYEVLAAPSGERALRIAADALPDLILLDVLMPEMDGYQVLVRLRADASTYGIPVIFVTGMDSALDEEKGFTLGAVDYVTKPYRPPIVLARLRTQLELKRARDRLANQNAYLEAEVARRTAENGLILESAAEGIVGIDTDGAIVFINPAAAAMLGYKGNELIGRLAHTALCHSRAENISHPHEECPVHLALASRVATRGKEGVMRRKDGSALPVELSAIPVQQVGCQLGAMASFTDISERKRYLAQLERHSNYDDMTGLPNRNLLADRFARAIGHCRHVGELAVLLIKLARFNDINESLGHAAGDRVLQAIATRIGELVKETDTLARLANDEFVVLAAGGEATASALAQATLAVLAQPVILDERELFISASIGIALCPKDGEDGDKLLMNASAAMNKALGAGGKVFRFYAAEMNARLLERLDFENELARALERDELVLHYQPQINLRNGEIVGCEALLRWQHPRRGLLPAGQFIPLAEQTGMIAAIGEWALRSACRQNKVWQDAGLPAVTMAVNLSAQQLAVQDVVELTRTILAETGMDPATLELELTESAAMADAEAFVDATQRLKALHVSLSIDDFGTGYSSFSYLKRFALDRLKIDLSFVRDITHDPNSASIIQAIISLAHDLKLAVIAEGVETEAQLSLLRGRGCDEMQGFYFSRAVPAAEFEQMLRERRRLTFPADADMPEHALLLVDDEPFVLASLKRCLRRDGYRIHAAESGMAGLDLLAKQSMAVVIADSRMPHMSGAEFLDKVRRLYPNSVRIMLSGYTDLTAVTDAVNKGELFKFLTKPWDDDELRGTLREAFRLYETRMRHHPMAS